MPGVKREKHRGRFIYLSDHPQIYSRQKQRRVSQQADVGFPTDSEAVEILVQLIKHPDLGIEQLLLPIGADLIQKEMAQVALELLRGELCHLKQKLALPRDPSNRRRAAARPHSPKPGPMSYPEHTGARNQKAEF